MIPITLFKNDLKLIVRDPVMVLLMVAPLLLISLFKTLEVFFIPFLTMKTGVDVLLYAPYIMSFVLVMNSSILGIVTGFMMLDDRDGNIVQLLEVTPLGRSGYLVNRLAFASILSAIYSYISLAVINLVDLPLYTVVLLGFLAAIYTGVIGLLIYSGADDKVKGLTYAKGLNTLILFVFTDLLALRWLTMLSWLFPPYWMALLVKSPQSLWVHALALLVHLAWFGVLLRRCTGQ